MGSNKSWLEISEQRLRHNFDALVQASAVQDGSISVLAVIKAGAYGHDARLCARVLASAGASWFGVTDAEEGVVVRSSLHRWNVIKPRILVMCGLLPEDAATMVRNQLTPVAWSEDQLGWLAQVSRAADPLSFHLEIDTGMSRQGVSPGRALEHLLKYLLTLPELRLEGVLTHFASAEIGSSPLTSLQQQRFETALAQISGKGFRPEWIHAGNSSAIDAATPLSWLQQIANRYRVQSLVRSGLALYGYCLPLEDANSTLQRFLHPVLRWKCRVVGLSDIPRGATVGYNATFTASAAMRVALLPVGYADGLRRELSATNAQPGGWVILHGQRAPIVGRVSMNLTTIDVTSIPEAALGDCVTVLGDGITADDHARLAHTIAYEILCGLRAPVLLTS